MRDYVARLIASGMTRETALAICRYFRRRGRLADLARYVTEVEEECRGEMDPV